MIERLPSAKINSKWDLKKLYHESKCKLSPAEKRGIKAGLADVRAGRVHTHEEVMNMIANKFKGLGLEK